MDGGRSHADARAGPDELDRLNRRLRAFGAGSRPSRPERPEHRRVSVMSRRDDFHNDELCESRECASVHVHCATDTPASNRDAVPPAGFGGLGRGSAVGAAPADARDRPARFRTRTVHTRGCRIVFARPESAFRTGSRGTVVMRYLRRGGGQGLRERAIGVPVPIVPLTRGIFDLIEGERDRPPSARRRLLRAGRGQAAARDEAASQTGRGRRGARGADGRASWRGPRRARVPGGDRGRGHHH